MKAKLLKLTDEQLFHIGLDYGYSGSREFVATELTKKFNSYNIKYCDLKHRYCLDK